MSRAYSKPAAAAGLDVIDDDSDHAELVGLILGHQGFVVVAAKGASDGVRRAKETFFDLTNSHPRR